MSYWADLTGASLSPKNVRVKGMCREGVERESSLAPVSNKTLGGRINSDLVFLISRRKQFTKSFVYSLAVTRVVPTLTCMQLKGSLEPVPKFSFYSFNEEGQEGRK